MMKERRRACQSVSAEFRALPDDGAKEGNGIREYAGSPSMHSQVLLDNDLQLLQVTGSEAFGTPDDSATLVE